jgi:hypothetical protein|tara:strand:+ start:597 stop:749 length:153 start_codon:yes stop_codon:yes gene_type:complete
VGQWVSGSPLIEGERYIKYLPFGIPPFSPLRGWVEKKKNKKKLFNGVKKK